MESEQTTNVTKKELSLEFFNEFMAFLEKKKFIIKDAVVGSKRKEYIKQKEFKSIVDQEKIEIVKMFKGLSNVSSINDDTPNLSDELIKLFRSQAFIIEAMPPRHEKGLKFPKKLIPFNQLSKDDVTEEEYNDYKSSSRKFYVLTEERAEKKSYFWLWLIIVLILAICLFPIWPLEVKLGIWWISWILSVFMIGLIVIRLIIYLFFFIFGFDIWIFPNLTDDKLGVIESFKPFISSKKRNETLYTIIFRLGIACLTGYIAYYIYENPNIIDDGIDHLWEIYQDVLSYGNEKIINYHNSTSISIVDKSNKYMNNILEEEEELNN